MPEQEQNQNQQQVQTQQSGSADKEDYGDKAFDFLAKKSGHTVSRETSEKITDGARGAFEKLTGKKVSEKISN